MMGDTRAKHTSYASCPEARSEMKQRPILQRKSLLGSEIHESALHEILHAKKNVARPVHEAEETQTDAGDVSAHAKSVLNHAGGAISTQDGPLPQLSNAGGAISTKDGPLSTSLHVGDAINTHGCPLSLPHPIGSMTCTHDGATVTTWQLPQSTDHESASASIAHASTCSSTILSDVIEHSISFLEQSPAWQQAQILREHGNSLARNKQHSDAIAQYMKMLTLLDKCRLDSNVGQTDAVAKQMDVQAAIAYLNLAGCFFQLREWEKTITAATAALLPAPISETERTDTSCSHCLSPAQRAKAHFRRGMALCEGYADYYEGKLDLEKAKTLSPHDASIAQAIQRCETWLMTHSEAHDDDDSACSSMSR